VNIIARSIVDDFDTILKLVDGKGTVVGENDDISGDNTNSQLMVTVPRTVLTILKCPRIPRMKNRRPAAAMWSRSTLIANDHGMPHVHACAFLIQVRETWEGKNTKGEV
jgi:hypothetical protein